MNKEKGNDRACGLDMPNGMDAKSRAKYTQKFVVAPMSMHPPRHKGDDKGTIKEAMTITLHC